MGDPGIASTALTAVTLTFRYWLTGRFAPTGNVTLTYLANSWSFNLATQPTVAPVTLGPHSWNRLPDPGDGYVIVATTVGDFLSAAPEITLRLIDPATDDVTTLSGWAVSIDTTPGSVVQLDTNVFRFKLVVTVDPTPALSSVIVEYSFERHAAAATRGRQRGRRERDVDDCAGAGQGDADARPAGDRDGDRDASETGDAGATTGLRSTR